MCSSPRDADLAGIAARLRALADGEAPLPADAVGDLVGAVTVLYAAAVRRAGREVPVGGAGLTPTDAVVLCCALLHAQDLNPFDLSLWFGRVERGPDPAR